MLVKVCCIQNEREVELAAAAGATHVGLVAAMPSGPGPIPDADIARIARSAPRSVVPVLLTSRTEADAIIDHVRSTGVKAVQIVAEVAGEIRETMTFRPSEHPRVPIHHPPVDHHSISDL
jgi:phosphoribosylanthranilate isomerase